MDEKVGGKLGDIAASLQDPDVEVRIAAVRSIAGVPVPSMDLFRLALADESWRVRKAAVETFAGLPAPLDFLPELIELLHHQENAGLRNAAIEILVGLGSQAIPALLRELQRPDVEVRKFLIDILGEIGNAQCADELIAILDDTDINVRYAAVETLGKLRIAKASVPLLKAMEDPDPGLRFTVLQALARIGGTLPVEKLFPYLEDRLLRKALFECFGRLGDKQVIPPLVKGLSDPLRNTREAALIALSELLSEHEDDILAELEKGDRGQIAEFLERQLANDKSASRQAALTLYGHVAEGRCPALLLDCLVDDSLRETAVRTFGRLGVEGYRRLIDSLGSPDSSHLMALIYVGGELRFPHALPLAREAICSADPQLRHVAAGALGRLGQEEDQDALLTLLDDEMTEIQEAAVGGLAALGARYPAEVLARISRGWGNAAADKRIRLLRVAGLIGAPGVDELLLKALKDAESTVRCEAVRGLQAATSEAVLSGLTLALTDESAEVRRLAVTALGNTGLAKALAALKLVASDDDLWVRAAVMRAMAGFGGEEVRAILLAGTADPIGPVVIAALESLARVLPPEAGERQQAALDHADTEVVKAALSQLQQQPDTTWMEVQAGKLLNHPHWEVRLQFARILGQSGLVAAEQLLRTRLPLESENRVRQALETVLAELLGSTEQNRV